jgi:hypothetical protein
VKRPDAYAIKKPTEQLINLIKRHFFEHEIIDTDKTFRYEKFQFIGKDTVYYESSVTILPAGKYSSAKKIFPAGSLLIRTDNNQANQIVQIFEPQSFYGLSHYSDYAYLCEGKEYPIYRIFIDKKK